MKHAGKEPFPSIYVDVKPESEAAKSGAKYELIAKAQLKNLSLLSMWMSSLNLRLQSLEL